VVRYEYDALGRLLRRIANPGTAGEEVTVNYWLGLSKLAEEHWGDEAGRDGVIFRPDEELHATPEQAGWGAVSWQSQPNAAIAYTTDTLRGKVTRIWATDQTSARYIIGDRPEEPDFFLTRRREEGDGKKAEDRKAFGCPRTVPRGMIGLRGANSSFATSRLRVREKNGSSGRSPMM